MLAAEDVAIEHRIADHQHPCMAELFDGGDKFGRGNRILGGHDGGLAATRFDDKDRLYLEEPHPVILKHHAGQMAAKNRAGVDAYTVGADDWGTLNGVAVDDNVVERAIMVEERFSDPAQIMRGLFGERNAGPDAGMDE